MNFIYNPKPTKIQVTKDELQYILFYVFDCQREVLQILNGYTDSASDKYKEFMINWHLADMHNKWFGKAFVIRNMPKTHKVNITISLIEQHILSLMFNRYKCGTMCASFEYKVLTNLKRLT